MSQITAHWTRQAAAIALLCLMAACGGGGDDDDSTPLISLGATATDALRGDLIRLGADVDAPHGIDSISFFRIDPGATVLLGVLYEPPATWDTVIPINAQSSVQYYARVCDVHGDCADSNALTVFVIE